MSALAELFRSLSLAHSRIPLTVTQTSIVPVRYFKVKKLFKDVPKPGEGKTYRRIVHYPEKYTIQPLKVTNLAGRDPVTGRKVVQGLGGGIKVKYHWIKWMRDGPAEGPPQEEKVIKVFKCGCRTADVALVGVGDEMKYILATENMKPGDIIVTSKLLTVNPVRPNEGDAYPLGSLPLGTSIHNVQIHPEKTKTLVHSAGCFAVIKKHIDNKVVVQLPSKVEMALDPRCMATVGRLSNAEHSSIPIGSPNRARELGFRPRSGLRQKKTGRFGRKIKPLPPVKHYTEPKPKREVIRCTHSFYAKV